MSWYAGSYGVWLVGVLAAVLTAFYMARETFLVFFGNQRWDDDKHPHESPWVMTVPLVVLGTLAVVGGVVNLPFTSLEYLAEWLEHSIHGAPDLHASSFVEGALLSALAVTMGLVGIAAAVSLYRRGLKDRGHDPLDDRLGPIAPVLHHAWYYDETISRVVEGPLRRFAGALAWFDQHVVDGAVNGVGGLVRASATRLRRLQTGYVRNYAAAILLGAVALVAFVVIRAGS
jgi:NADH-quinone oxidoreductase subunit L